MSTWTTPITFTASSTLTAAQMNTEVRDHLNFIKGALDLLTGSTTADTGSTMRILAPTTSAFGAGNTIGTSIAYQNIQAWLNSKSMIALGDAAAGLANPTIYFYRTGAGAETGGMSRIVQLASTAGLSIQNSTSMSVAYGSETYLTVAEFDRLGGLLLDERTAPTAPAANRAHIFAVDNGSGKTRLSVQFPTGAAQTIATEP